MALLGGRAIGDARSRIRRALLAVLGRDAGAATRELEEIVREDSDDFEVYLALAWLYREQGEAGRALRVHQNLLLRSDLPPRLRSHALRGLAEDLRAAGHRERAIAVFEELLAHEPGDAPAARALCELLVEGGHYERALERVSGGWLGRGGDPEREAALLVALARQEHEAGDAASARRRLRRAVRRDPRSARARIALGELEAERGRDRAALGAWRGALGLEQDDPDALWERLASACAALDRPAELEKLARERVAAQPSDGAACRALARLLVSRGEIDAAIAELRRGLDAAPGDLRTRGRLGRLLLAEGRETDAAKELGELLEVLEARPDMRAEASP